MRVASREAPAPSSPALRLADGVAGGLRAARCGLALLATVVAAGLAVGLGFPGDAKKPAAAPAAKPAGPSAAASWKDDESPLPAGAVARVGSNRLRHGRGMLN